MVCELIGARTIVRGGDRSGMKLFGVQVGKPKALTFEEFRDSMRLHARRLYAGCTLENGENGFTLTISGRTETCNIRGVYASYCKNPGDLEKIAKQYLESLQVENPVHSWQDAMPLLRPSIRSAAFLEAAARSLARQKEPDSLPSIPFAGDLHVISVVEFKSRLWAVTQNGLDQWGVDIQEVLRTAHNNMSMLSFPTPNSTFTAAGGKEELGLTFEGDHLTATWIVMDRFRDYLGQRLQGNYVISACSRSKLTAVRADETGLVATLRNQGRNFQSLPYPLTGQLFKIDMDVTGGSVAVLDNESMALNAGNMFASGVSKSLPSITQAAQGISQGVAFDQFMGLSESVNDTPPPSSGSARRG